MAEPTTEWGREAVSDIRSLQQGVDGLKRDVGELRSDMATVKSDLSNLRLEFTEFRAEIRALLGVTRLLFTTFAVLVVGGALGVAFTVMRLGVQIDEVQSNVEELAREIRRPTVQADNRPIADDAP